MKYSPSTFVFCLTCLASSLAQSSSAIYLEGDFGGGFSNWNNSVQANFPSGTGVGSTNVRSIKGNQGFAGGGSIGYRHHFWSIEAGAFGLPTMNYNIQSGAGPSSIIKDVGQISQWFIDGLVKLSVPVPQQPAFEVFGKFGAAYRAGGFSDQETSSGLSVPIVNTVYANIEPILGGGLQYHLNSNWVFNVQYLFLPYATVGTTPVGPLLNDHSLLPSAQLVTGGISYYFDTEHIGISK